jgi:uncharacterized membrane protein YfcA
LSLIGLGLAIVIGVSLGFFGGGGSILTVPLLVYVFGLEAKQAIASSLLIVAIASISGAVQHWRAGNVRPKEALFFGVAGMVGAYGGGRASEFLDGGLLLLLFATMMLLTATAMWRGRKDPGNKRDESMRSPAKLALQGFAVGAFTGLVGAGGGFLIVPALALWAGLPMTAAVGTSLVIIVLKSGSAFLGYSSHVQVDYSLVGQISVAAIAGSFLGSRLANQVDPDSLRRAFAAFVMVMALFILVREGTLLVSTLSPAMPTSWPQLAFALAMLGLGILAGRSSKQASKTQAELAYSEGAGI